MSHFAVRNLSVLSYAQGFTEWHYKALCITLAEALAPGFFDPIGGMLKRGDTVMISATNGGALVFVHSASEADGVRVEVMARTGAR